MTKKEKEIIITALIFLGSVDASYEGDHKKFIKLAIKLGKKYDIDDLRNTGLEMQAAIPECPSLLEKVGKHFLLKWVVVK